MWRNCLLAYFRVFQSFQFSDQDRADWLFVSLPFIMTLLGVGLYHLGRYQSKGENPFLVRLLVDAMDAKPKARAAASAKPAPKAEPSAEA